MKLPGKQHLSHIWSTMADKGSAACFAPVQLVGQGAREQRTYAVSSSNALPSGRIGGHAEGNPVCGWVASAPDRTRFWSAVEALLVRARVPKARLA
jgi:hypothetical protein